MSRIAGLFAGAAFPWWICGGHALDLFLGRVTRDHGDMDVGVLRSDLGATFERLDDFEVHAAKDGTLRELSPEERRPGSAFHPQIHGYWCRPRGAQAWAFEVLANEGDPDTFVFRRDPRITRPLADCVRRNDAGVPYLVPELQLLFKAKAAREKDERDLAAILPALAPEARSWLSAALGRAHHGHPWLTALEAPRTANARWGSNRP